MLEKELNCKLWCDAFMIVKGLTSKLWFDAGRAVKDLFTWLCDLMQRHGSKRFDHLAVWFDAGMAVKDLFTWLCFSVKAQHAWRCFAMKNSNWINRYAGSHSFCREMHSSCVVLWCLSVCVLEAATHYLWVCERLKHFIWYVAIYLHPLMLIIDVQWFVFIVITVWLVCSL